MLESNTICKVHISRDTADKDLNNRIFIVAITQIWKPRQQCSSPLRNIKQECRILGCSNQDSSCSGIPGCPLVEADDLTWLQIIVLLLIFIILEIEHIFKAIADPQLSDATCRAPRRIGRPLVP